MKRIIKDYCEYTDSWFGLEVEDSEFVDKIYQKITNLLPTRLIYFCYFRFMAFATTHDEGSKMTSDEITFSKATEIWSRYH